MKLFFTSSLMLVLVATTHLSAATIEDEERAPFSSWNYAVPATGGSFPYIAYEIKRTGFHTVDIHFKNFANNDISFNFWIPGFEQTTIPQAVRVPVSAPNDREWIVPIELTSGSTGLRFSDLKMSNIKIEGQMRRYAQGAIPPPIQAPFAPDEAWLSVATDQSLVEFSSETVAYRIVHNPDESHVVFRNTGRENVYFDFVLKGYQSAENSINPRVSLGIHKELTVPLILSHSDQELALARIKAYNVRINGDSGPFLDENNMEEGWFAVTAVNCPAFNPNQLMYRFEDSNSSHTTIHFKNISRLPVSFKFGVSLKPITTEAKIAAEGDVRMDTESMNDALPNVLKRIRVTDVRYGQLKPAASTIKSK